MVLLSAVNLCKAFGGIVALSNLSLSVKERELLGVIGPNGAGKTTLFNVLTGFYKPDKGCIKFKGRDITNLPPHEKARLGIVKTHQIPRPFSNLTVMENLLVACLSSRNNRDISYCLEVLEEVGLYDVKDKYANSLTPSQLRDLEIARAVVCKPVLLLLDEPAAGRRGKEIEDFAKFIDNIRKMGTTIILVEHRMDVISQIAERLLVMHQGAKLAEGTPKEVLTAEAVIKTYLGEEAL
jgi:branched-chain amino acid transport system ATP-binding protein